MLVAVAVVAAGAAAPAPTQQLGYRRSSALEQTTSPQDSSKLVVATAGLYVVCLNYMCR